MSLATVAILVLASSVLVECTDISATPRAQPFFNSFKYSGIWYNQYKIVQWNWSGSNDFTDWRLNFMFKAKQKYLVMDWRSRGQCTSVTSSMYQTAPGTFIIKDPIGDMFTGEQRMVATDYIRFSVTWGCIRRSPDGRRCIIPWLTVETRAVFPDDATYRAADWVLRKHFGFGLNRMKKIIHKHPC